MSRPVNNRSAPRRENRDRDTRDQRDYRDAPPQPRAEAPKPPLLWGIHAFREAWLNPQRHIREAWLTSQAAQALTETLATPGLRRPNPRIMDSHEFKSLFREDAVHQGACLWGEALAQPTFEDWLAEGPSRVIILDQVTDPHNVGAIMRSAAAFGFQGLIMQDRHAPPISGTLTKTASGAIDHLPLMSVVNISRAIDTLKENGFFAIGLAEEESVPFATLPKYDRLALVLGAEGDGLRDGVRKSCDACAALPTVGAIRSLNVSAAAAAAMMATTL